MQFYKIEMDCESSSVMKKQAVTHCSISATQKADPKIDASPKEDDGSTELESDASRLRRAVANKMPHSLHMFVVVGL